MKKNMRSFWKAISLVVATVAVVFTAQAYETVYDNSTTYLGSRYWAVNTEFGDEVVLDSSTSDRVLKEIKFEYWLSHDVNANEFVNLKIYANDGDDYFGGGTTFTPGTLLYQSGSFAIGSGQRNVTITVPDGGPVLPENFTWVVSFSGVSGSEQVGLLFYDPPTVGSSLDDYWELVGDSWTLKKFEGGPVANFGAQIIAVPEPSTIALGLVGAALLGLTLRRRS